MNFAERMIPVMSGWSGSLANSQESSGVPAIQTAPKEKIGYTCHRDYPWKASLCIIEAVKRCGKCRLDAPADFPFPSFV